MRVYLNTISFSCVCVTTVFPDTKLWCVCGGLVGIVGGTENDVHTAGNTRSKPWRGREGQKAQVGKTIKMVNRQNKGGVCVRVCACLRACVGA